MKSIYVGNLSFKTTDAELNKLFAQHGKVISAKVVMDRETGKSRGFGFVQMEDAEASNAIKNLNGADFQGRALRVNEAQERPERPAMGDRPPRRPRM